MENSKMVKENRMGKSRTSEWRERKREEQRKKRRIREECTCSTCSKARRNEGTNGNMCGNMASTSSNQVGTTLNQRGVALSTSQEPNLQPCVEILAAESEDENMNDINIPLQDVVGSVQHDEEMSDFSCSDYEVEQLQANPVELDEYEVEEVEQGEEGGDDLQAIGEEEGGQREEIEDEDSEEDDADEAEEDDFQPYDPDDPDDPGYPEDPEPAGPDVGDGQGHNFNDNDIPDFGLNHPYMNVHIQLLHNLTVREVLLLTLTLAVRHSLTYECLLDIFRAMNAIFGRQYFPASKDKLWDLLGRSDIGIRKYYYCGRCFRMLDNFPELPERFQCESCQFWNTKRYVRKFFSLDLRKQLKNSLNTQGFPELLRYREERVKKVPENIEDIMDGSVYREKQEPGGILHGPDNYSYVWNGDGVKLVKSGNTEAFPIYIRLNELPPLIRQKYIFLAGVWVDQGNPNINLLLDTFVDQANTLQNEGVRWTLHGVDKTSRFVPLGCTADSKARCQVLQMTEPTGFCACGFCDIVGVQARGVKFPNWPAAPPHDDMPEPQPRTHATIIRDMIEAHHVIGGVNGFKGPSALINLENFDLKKCFSTDDLHPIFLGVVKDYFEELFTPGGDFYIGNPQNIAVINRRWTAIKFPTCISRKPRKIETWKRWRGHEFRNFLYYGLPCLEGVGILQDDDRPLTNLQRLAEIVFQLSKDSISEEDLVRAEENISLFSLEFEDMFGVEGMKFNIHMMLHLAEVVRALGNLWAHTTYNFESWNHIIKKFVTSSFGVCEQITNRLLMVSFVLSGRFDARISNRIRLAVESIMLRTRLDNAVHIGDVYLLGKSEYRQCTQEERNVLQAHRVVCDNVVREFKRAYFQNMECRSLRYVREGKSDNSHIYTWDDMFARIQSILVLNPNNEDPTCGMICQVYNNLQPVPLRSFMWEIRPDQQGLVWVPFSELRSLAVKISIPDITYIARMPNHIEID